MVRPGRRREHAQHVSCLKIYFRSRLTTVASRILKSLLTGLKNGSPIVSRDSDLRPAEVTNYKSATGDDVRDKVEKTTREEIQRGNYIITTEKHTVVNALGAILERNRTVTKSVLSTTAADPNIAMYVNLYTDTQQSKLMYK